MQSARKRILLADDEADFLTMLQDTFQGKPWAISIANDGEEALQKMRGDSFDLGILDLYMPGLNGLEVIQQIQKLGLRISVILMTGYGTREGTLQKAVQAVKDGAVDVIEKPFSRKNFVALIERLLHQGDHSTRRLADQLDSYVKTHAFEPDLNLEVLSEHFHITPRYVSELFRKNLDTTFGKCLTNHRVQKARQLMESTDLPLYEIADQCGFRNYRRLTAAFHRVYKMPPRRFRELDL